MELDDQALPLTRGQLDIWLAQELAQQLGQEAGHCATEWQLGLLARVEGRVDRESLQQAIRQVVREAEPGRAAFCEEAGQVVQRVIDYPDVELAFYDLRGAQHPVQDVGEIASSIQRTPMPLSGPLFKFALFQTHGDEFYLFACCHHIVIDGLGMVLVSRRLAAIYTAIVRGEPIPAAYFGSLHDLVRSESEYEASPDYHQDRCRLPGERDHFRAGFAMRMGPPVCH